MCISLLVSIKLDQLASRGLFEVSKRAWDPCRGTGWAEGLYWYLRDP